MSNTTGRMTSVVLGDVVRIGKGKAEWTVTGFPRVHTLSLRSAAGAVRTVKITETDVFLISRLPAVAAVADTACAHAWTEASASGRKCGTCGAAVFAVGDRVIVRGMGTGAVVSIDTEPSPLVRLDNGDEGYWMRSDLAPVTVSMAKRRPRSMNHVIITRAKHAGTRYIMSDVTEAAYDSAVAAGVDSDTAYDEAKTMSSRLFENDRKALQAFFALAR